MAPPGVDDTKVPWTPGCLYVASDTGGPGTVVEMVMPSPLYAKNARNAWVLARDQEGSPIFVQRRETARLVDVTAPTGAAADRGGARPVIEGTFAGSTPILVPTEKVGQTAKGDDPKPPWKQTWLTIEVESDTVPATYRPPDGSGHAHLLEEDDHCLLEFRVGLWVPQTPAKESASQPQVPCARTCGIVLPGNRVVGRHYLCPHVQGKTLPGPYTIAAGKKTSVPVANMLVSRAKRLEDVCFQSSADGAPGFEIDPACTAYRTAMANERNLVALAEERRSSGGGDEDGPAGGGGPPKRRRVETVSLDNFYD